MNEDGWLTAVAKFTGGGVGIGGGIYLIRWFILWLTGRHDKRQADLVAEESQLNRAWQAYRLTLEARCARQDEKIEHLETEFENCQREKHALEGRVVALEAMADARGEMRQTKQIKQSTEALIDRLRSAED